MQITITARHFDLTKAIREHVEESVLKLKKYFDQIIHAHLILSLENNRNIVELVLHVPKNDFKCEAEAMDMYLAVDSAVEKMEQQIKKLKGKWTDYQKKNLRDNTQYVYANLIEKQDQRKTVKIKRIMAEAMSVQEAIDKFEASEDTYYIFRNIESDRINVLVKKDEMHYKLIEP
ncbi:MAG: ribosome-associated translation inhibitor RaiA [Candidatus Cloacimonetes bacterium]|nr:ribosome-associated translation inhibitor RaiA [Candidatus Cloacimonadota bacterium]